MVPLCFHMHVELWLCGTEVSGNSFWVVLGRCCFQLEMYGNHMKWNREERYVACCRPGTQAVTFLALELLGTQRFEETAV